MHHTEKTPKTLSQTCSKVLNANLNTSTPQQNTKNVQIYEETTSALLVDQKKHTLTDAQAHIASNVCNI